MTTTVTKVSSTLEFLNDREIMHVASVVCYALTENMTFKRAYYDLCPPIGSDSLNDKMHHGQVRGDVADVSSTIDLTHLLFLCSVRLVNQQAVSKIDVQNAPNI